jgi:hypothetical protein
MHGVLSDQIRAPRRVDAEAAGGGLVIPRHIVVRSCGDPKARFMGIAGEEISDDVPVTDDLNGIGEPAGGRAGGELDDRGVPRVIGLVGHWILRRAAAVDDQSGAGSGRALPGIDRIASREGGAVHLANIGPGIGVGQPVRGIRAAVLHKIGRGLSP